MNCFELIKGVLDNLWDNLEGTEEEKVEQIKTAIDYLSKNYHRIATSEKINYDDKYIQFAYIYVYTASHADYLFQLLTETQQKRPIITTNNFRISSLGGGPGSDLIGCLKYIDSLPEKTPLKLKFNSFDRNHNWSFCWSNLSSSFSELSDNKEQKLELYPTFHYLDITDPNSLDLFKPYLDSNLITMIYFLSEILKCKDSSKNFLDYLFSNVNQGTILVLVDNKMDPIKEWFNEYVNNNSYETIIEFEDKIVASSDEEVRILQVYKNKFNHSPKIESKVMKRVVRKIK
ncbi:MAG: hypothetical protein LBE13_19120 [Bacteroidales bacterium]|jgi:hypothetical protein|nr:hypothetical protein [Bacteroidales bacterium]